MEEHPQARFIVETLAKAGFVAYYAGGWVRDLLLQRPSDDIDIATNAPPETIQALFSHTVPVGIAFGIVIVIIDHHQYEVATFRQDLDYHDGRRPSRIEFTTAEKDAKRRDFTINGMFFDPLNNTVLDYVGGKIDLQHKLIRAIGNPHERIREDRLRMIRAIRLSCRFDFAIDPPTEMAIRAHINELFPAVAIERVWQELSKGHAFGNLHCMLIKLNDFGLLQVIFPTMQFDEKRLEQIKSYPKEAPVIASILPLFNHCTLEDEINLCKRLKLSNEEIQFVSFLHRANKLKTDVEWAHFFANCWSDLCIVIMGATYGGMFLDECAKRKNELDEAVVRIQNKTPVVSALDLQKEGVEPGPKMGLLLREAEAISIETRTYDKSMVISWLKKSDKW